MGRLLLLLVLASVLGGSIYTMSQRGAFSDAARVHSAEQQDALAREIAEAGQSVALTHMVKPDRLVDPTKGGVGKKQSYEDGRFHIAYAQGATEREATLTVTGTYGGAVHTVQSTYELDPSDAPGPLWLDVPYATASASGAVTFSGDADDHPVHLDRRKHEELGLDGFLEWTDVAGAVGGLANAAGSALKVPANDAWTGEDGLLEDLNVEDADGLFMAAEAAAEIGGGDDQILTGPLTVANNQTWGSKHDGTTVTLVRGDLTVTGRLRGHGALAIDGGLTVEPGGTLEWEGLVVVRSDEDVLPIKLDGTVAVTGMMAVAHRAFPPGGHLDVTVFRNASGMAQNQPRGTLAEQQSPWSTNLHASGTRFPWHQHTHAFDLKPTHAPRGDHVFFLPSGSLDQEPQVQFKSLLDKLGSEPVYLEIANADNHGFSTVHLDVSGAGGTGGMLHTTVRTGFGDFASAANPRRTTAFAADRLADFSVDVRSLRSLRQSFDTAGACAETSDWPYCTGIYWDRLGAMSVRLHRASDGARLYEASLYWHMRADEEDAHEAEEQAWREKIQNGEAFGTHLSMDGTVDMTFDMTEILELKDKLGFDGPEVELVTSSVSHVPPSETADGTIVVCHDPPAANQTKTIDFDSLSGHLGHGDFVGRCEPTSGPSTPPSAPTPSDDAQVTLCLLGTEITIDVGDLDLYLALGATEGSCGGGGGMTWVCHNGTWRKYSMWVPSSWVPYHQSHGDTVGQCSSGGGSS